MSAALSKKILFGKKYSKKNTFLEKSIAKKYIFTSYILFNNKYFFAIFFCYTFFQKVFSKKYFIKVYYKMFLDSIKYLCTPAYIYLVISIIATIILMIQNSGNQSTYCVGNFECPVPSTPLVFLVKFLYIAFWTFVLNSICRAGHKQFAWFLVLLPFIMFFILIGMLMLKQGVN